MGNIIIKEEGGAEEVKVFFKKRWGELNEKDLSELSKKAKESCESDG